MREQEATMAYAVPSGPREGKDIPAGYKRTEVGVIPEDWQTRRIGDLFEARAGGDFNPTRSSYVQSETHKYPIYANSLSQQGLYGFCSEPDNRSGLITVTARGTLGKAFYRDTLFVAIGRLLVLDSKVSMDARYFCEFINHGVHFAIESTGVPQLTAPQVEGYYLPVPPPYEQRIIADALSDVDGLLETLEGLIAKKRVVKQAAMQQLLNGKTRLPGFSGEWTIRRLVDCGVFRSGNGFPIKFQGNQSGDYPFFKVSDINNRGNQIYLENANHWISDAVKRVLGANSFPVGSIVFAKIGAAIFLERKRMLSRESCLDNNMMAFSLTAPGYCERFFYYLFLSMEFGKLVSTTALPSLSGRAIGSIGVSVPPKEEQRAIAAVFSDMDAEIAVLQRRRDKTRTLKQGMMQQLLTGRIRLVRTGVGSTRGKPRSPRRKHDLTEKVHPGIAVQRSGGAAS